MINDNLNIKKPDNLENILFDTIAIQFTALCEEKTGALLRALSASKPNGRFLEIGTGTGVSTCWIHDGMSEGSHLKTIELEPENHKIAKKHLGKFKNIEFILGDAVSYINSIDEKFDLVFADTFPGKFSQRERILESIQIGGYYIIDDLLPQINWPEDDHPMKVRQLIKFLENDARFQIIKMNWASGLIICIRKDN